MAAKGASNITSVSGNKKEVIGNFHFNGKIKHNKEWIIILIFSKLLKIKINSNSIRRP